MLRVVSLSVITSYSIHYTKLYDGFLGLGCFEIALGDIILGVGRIELCLGRGPAIKQLLGAFLFSLQVGDLPFGGIDLGIECLDFV